MEKRRIQRVHLESHVRGKLADLPVAIVDLSTTGARLQHRLALVTGVRTCLQFTFNSELIFLPCEIVRCTLEKDATSNVGGFVYCSGVRFFASDAGTAQLRQLVELLVIRELRQRRSQRVMPGLNPTGGAKHL